MTLPGVASRRSAAPADAVATPIRNLVLRLAGLGDDRFPIAPSPLPPLEQALLWRLAAARLTPSGWPQPPELAGVNASVRIPNPLQPMSGEFLAGNEVDAGRPAFLAVSSPPASTREVTRAWLLGAARSARVRSPVATR